MQFITANSKSYPPDIRIVTHALFGSDILVLILRGSGELYKIKDIICNSIYIVSWTSVAKETC